MIQTSAVMDALPHLVPGRRVSFTVGQMMGSHEMYQFKGFVEEFRGPMDISEFAVPYFEHFCGQADMFGMPPEFLDKIRQTPTNGYVLRIRVEEQFGQTPGPGAGDALKEAR